MTPELILRLVEEEESRRKAESDLYEFVKQAWNVVEPGVVFTHGWHLETICDHLEAVTAGEIQRLLINIPPRHAKSTIVAVMWPVWEWLQHPEARFLCASYSSVLSTRDALKARRLIQSPWFQQRWGHKFTLTGDQNAKQRYENDRTGYRIATSVGGTATGEGGSRLILDDPHGAQAAQSDTIRESDLEWFDMVWSTRLNNPRTDAMVTIMQRLHEQDVSGHIINDLKNWEHICLPAEWDGLPRKTSLGQYDQRTVKNSLLWPERFTKEVLTSLKQVLGEYGSAGQLQQNPVPSGGGILKVDNFQLWGANKPLPVFDFVIQSVDPAYTEKTQNDPTAFMVWGVFEEKGRRGALLLDVWAEHLAYPDLRKRLIEEWHSRYGGGEFGKGRKADCILIEGKASGLSLQQDLRSANIPVHTYVPTTDKVNRAHQVAPILEMGCLWIPESKKNKGAFVTWASDFLEEVKRFPVSKNDDMVDALSQAMIYLRDSGYFEMDEAEEDEEPEFDYRNVRQSGMNPYAS